MYGLEAPTITAIAQIITAAAAVGGTAYTIASAPGTPKAPEPPKPPPLPPGAPAPPPPAPTETIAQEGVAAERKRAARRFGQRQTLFSDVTGGVGTQGTRYQGRGLYQTLGG